MISYYYYYSLDTLWFHVRVTTDFQATHLRDGARGSLRYEVIIFLDQDGFPGMHIPGDVTLLRVAIEPHPLDVTLRATMKIL